MIGLLSIIEYNYVSSWGTTKEVWNTLEKIYEVLTEIKRESMNTLD